ncbi:MULTISPECIES: GNAT family N-acetyltransferase [Vibrio]|uniref:GNAT family N-acetyltransferase n=2 Tax=Vibrio TaxID=662 RepID=A0A7X4RTM7_9VIBR|nr:MULTISPECIES: GNAT family N-acetyltransferase [Vibrio]MBF9002445.1 GNAT family N-acetyltransferase [Vibrio nitrifigilis]MZI92976.1 GNAT family N-acetyltransferase [Vibrio eleionomae]
MEIRAAEYRDYENIAKLHALSWRTHYHGILGEEYLENEVLEDRLLIWQTRLTNPPFNQHIVLIEEQDELLGFICVFGNHDFDKGTIIESLHVAPKHRGKGLGKLLIQEALKWVDHYFADSGVYIEVMEENHQAVDFYDHIGGIHQLERAWKAPCGHTIPEFIYTWETPKQLAEAVH